MADNRMEVKSPRTHAPLCRCSADRQQCRLASRRREALTARSLQRHGPVITQGADLRARTLLRVRAYGESANLALRARAAFLGLSTLEQACLLTIPVLLLYGTVDWYVSVPVSILALAALLFPRVRANHWLWFTMACFLISGVLVAWTTADNHKYLIAYWTLAVALAAGTVDADRQIALSARLLIGLTFAFALVWKVLTPDFATGEFFHYSLLFDARFSSKVVALGILEPSAAEANRLAREALTSPTSVLESTLVATNSTITALGRLLTIWTLMIEALVALTFLCPPSWRVARTRDIALLAFILTAYAAAPVLGFASVLTAMGFVQCERARVWTRAGYLVAFLAIQCFRIPWTTLLDPGS
jgi:hypothetical protein